MFADHYANLIAGQWPATDADSAFDRHVLACILSVAFDEKVSGRTSLTEATGLSARDLMHLVARNFPVVSLDLAVMENDGEDPVLEEEEELLLALLLRYADPTLSLGPHVARLVARRAMRDDHLWQDLGLFARTELSRLLKRYFPELAAGNTQNMKWKKYFYRKLCEAEGFSLCTAPSCRECSDFDACFGEETGESHLARIRNGYAVAAA